LKCPNTIFLPNNPGAANDFMMQILAGLRGNMGSTTNSPTTPPPHPTPTTRTAQPWL
jgi:hypothetical protein